MMIEIQTTLKSYQCEYCEYISESKDTTAAHEKLHTYTKTFVVGEKVLAHTGRFIEKPVMHGEWNPITTFAKILEIDVDSYRMLLEEQDGKKEWVFSFNIEKVEDGKE